MRSKTWGFPPAIVSMTSTNFRKRSTQGLVPPPDTVPISIIYSVRNVSQHFSTHVFSSSSGSSASAVSHVSITAAQWSHVSYGLHPSFFRIIPNWLIALRSPPRSDTNLLSLSPLQLKPILRCLWLGKTRLQTLISPKRGHVRSGWCHRLKNMRLSLPLPYLISDHMAREHVKDGWKGSQCRKYRIWTFLIAFGCIKYIWYKKFILISAYLVVHCQLKYCSMLSLHISSTFWWRVFTVALTNDR